MFEQYSTVINRKYPDLVVMGDLYPPPEYRVILARCLAALKIILILLVISGVDFYRYLNEPCPVWWAWCLRNKIYSSLSIFFIINAIEGQLVSTGAFEISLDGRLLWSKLEKGRLPDPVELFRILERELG